MKTRGEWLDMIEQVAFGPDTRDSDRLKGLNMYGEAMKYMRTDEEEESLQLLDVMIGKLGGVMDGLGAAKKGGEGSE